VTEPNPEPSEAAGGPAAVAGSPHGADRGWSRRVIGPFTVRHLIVAIVILLAAAALLALLGTPVMSPGSAGTQTPGSGFYQIGEPTEGLAIGQLAPELEGPVDGQTVGLMDLEGEPLRLADLRGRPVWLSFFATWCPPCQEETPVLREAFERYGPEGLRMVAVSVQETTADDVAAWADTYDLTYPIGFDASSAVFHAYEGFGLPTHVFIDRDGVIRDLRYGPLDREQVATIVSPLLAETAGASSPAGGSSAAAAAIPDSTAAASPGVPLE
jgi:cytochrome c biogenesis protein CcmG/thiol:disulfide interchange protein DsbE